MTKPVPFVATVRAWPNAKPKPPPEDDPWPSHALVVAYRTERPGGGALTYGIARLLGGDGPEPTWGIHGRDIRVSEARRFFGRGSGLAVLAFDEGLGIKDTLEAAGDGRRTDFLEAVWWPTIYKPPLRAALVAWSVSALVSSLAWRVDARGDRYRFTIATWHRPEDGELLPNTFRAGVRVSPSSLGRAQVAFAPHRGMKPWEFVQRGRKRVQYAGRFLSLSQAVGVTTGEDQLTLGEALRAYGIAVPEGGGADGLLARLDALSDLYRGVVADLGRWPVDVAPDRLGSPAALAKAIVRRA